MEKKTKQNKPRQKSKKGKKKSIKLKVVIPLAVLGTAVIIFLFLANGNHQEKARLSGLKLLNGAGFSLGTKTLTLTPQPVLSESPVVASVTGADLSPGSKSVYEWERNGMVIPSETSAVLEKNQFKKGDTLRAALLMDGGKERLISEPAVVQNSPPKVIGVKIEPVQPGRGDKLQVKAESSDEDGDPVTYRYRWFTEAANGDNAASNPSVGDQTMLLVQPFPKGTKIGVEVTPFDGETEGIGLVASSVVIVNSPPRITSSPVSFSGKEYTYQVTAEDPDQDPLTFKLTKSPAGMTIDSKTGMIKWAFTEKDQGTHPVEIRVSDPDGSEVVQSFDIPLSFAAAPPP